MGYRSSRRRFLTDSALLAGATLALPQLARAATRRSPNELLDLVVVGVANRGAENLNAVSGENIVALCDTDESYLARAAERFPKAQTFTDLRVMFERVKADAAVVSTPDHTHAPAGLRALDAGMHLYCEKPLAHTVAEARRMTELAAEKGLVTQMGTQIHAGENYRRVVERIRAGTIGAVREVHVFCAKAWSGNGVPEGTPEVPEGFHYDLWLGPAQQRPYHPNYHPASWRRYWDFGGGTLGDMACHYVDLPFWALELDAPTRIEAEGPPVDAYSAPDWVIVRYDFPARGERPALKLTWYDGGKRPAVLAGLGLGDWHDGVLFVGDEGALVSSYGRHVLLPERKFADFEPPAPTLPGSIGHHAEWIEACKNGGETTCSFDYSGPLTEAVQLGVVAYRAGAPVDWHAATLEARGAQSAPSFVRRAYREGWSV